MPKITGTEAVSIARRFGLSLVDASAIQRLSEDRDEAIALAAEYSTDDDATRQSQARAETMKAIPR